MPYSTLNQNLIDDVPLVYAFDVARWKEMPPHDPSEDISKLTFTMNLPKHAYILDVGCGVGRWVKPLLERGVAGYVGVDNCHEMIAHARKTFPALDFRLGDIRHISRIVDGSIKFDGFIAEKCLMHVPTDDIDKTLSGIRQLLTAGACGRISTTYGQGRRILTHPANLHVPPGRRLLIEQWTPETLEPHLRGAGFEISGTPVIDKKVFSVIVRAV